VLLPTAIFFRVSCQPTAKLALADLVRAELASEGTKNVAPFMVEKARGSEAGGWRRTTSNNEVLDVVLPQYLDFMIDIRSAL
jgi:hypothetical protein